MPISFPTVSMIIMSYNRERYLVQAIESVLNQTFKHFELLIWDDGSTDDSLAIAQSYAQKDSRVRVVAAPHLGLNPGLKAAVASTIAPFIGWVDSDDYLDPKALQATVPVLQKRDDIGFVYTDYYVTNEKGENKGVGHRAKIPYSKQRLMMDFMTFHFRLLRRSALEAAGGIDDTLSCAQDYDMCVRLSEVAEVAHVTRPLYYYRVHPKNISTENRYEQIMNTKALIERAMTRRGLDTTHELKLELVSRFKLIKKPVAKKSSKLSAE